MPEVITKLLLAGCGHMGSALLRGWQNDTGNIAITIADPVYSGEIAHVSSITDLANGYRADIVFIAVPPQIAASAINELGACLHPQTLVVSIMAGKSVAWLQTQIGQHPYVARVMPNMPAAIGQGVCGYYAPGITPAHILLLERLLAVIGKVVAVSNEDHINVVTAVSGSGPAYVFMLADAMTKAGVALGLPAETARILALHTVAGSGQYALQSPHNTDVLVDHIAISGGTTEAAVHHLRNHHFTQLMCEAISHATRRAREL